VRDGPLAWLASRGAQQAADPATDQQQVKRDGRGAEAPPRHAGSRPWGGRSPRGAGRSLVTKRGSVARTNSRVDESPEDEQRRSAEDPRKRRSRLLAPPPRKGDARPAGGKSRGHAGGDELPGLRERHEPLKGRPQERHLPENGRTAEGGRSRREVEKTCGRHRSWQGGTCWQIPG
jgi:hypothetical protein